MGRITAGEGEGKLLLVVGGPRGEDGKGRARVVAVDGEADALTWRLLAGVPQLQDETAGRHGDEGAG